MIRVLAAPTEIVLSSGSYARTYRLLREVEDDDIALTAYTNQLRADTSVFPSNVTIRSLDKPNRLSYFGSLYRKLNRIIRSDQFDVYQHANLGFREFNPAVLLPPNTPFLVGPAEAGHSVPSAEFKRVLARQVDRDVPDAVEGLAANIAEPVVRSGLNPVRERLFAATLERADRIVAVHSDAKDTFEQYTETDKIEVIPYGVDMGKFPFESNTGNQSFVTVGNLIERKGHRYLLDAMKMVTDEFPNAELHMIGTGPLREKLESRAEANNIKESVTFHGFVEHEKLLELLHHSRAFVHPSLSEGFSHVRLEAMSAGCPVIGTDISGAEDLTRDGMDGRIVPTADSKALANAMLELLADDELVEDMGKYVREKIEQEHDYTDIAQRYLQIYREMADPEQ